MSDFIRGLFSGSSSSNNRDKSSSTQSPSQQPAPSQHDAFLDDVAVARTTDSPATAAPGSQDMQMSVEDILAPLSGQRLQAGSLYPVPETAPTFATHEEIPKGFFEEVQDYATEHPIIFGASIVAAALATRMGVRAIRARTGCAGASTSKYYKGGFDPKMNAKEALLILGLAESSLTRTKLKEAHRRIMLLNHPDRGGSPYMATKINEAKDFLEKNKRLRR
ncbi:uncharacterized protein V1518DRAFT_392759 [Limtongia smithiae]|uniref:uncharacterized protein n=1 Tax=Limtongia smithiae TaxID=1125753 RepID=UPI0034CE198A